MQATHSNTSCPAGATTTPCAHLLCCLPLALVLLLAPAKPPVKQWLLLLLLCLATA
jgi:hypothetical protein